MKQTLLKKGGGLEQPCGPTRAGASKNTPELKSCRQEEARAGYRIAKEEDVTSPGLYAENSPPAAFESLKLTVGCRLPNSGGTDHSATLNSVTWHHHCCRGPTG